ncbi:Nn.00g030190.m01.CDS01 [Neocucurbitaria sp. VM-36]
MRPLLRPPWPRQIPLLPPWLPRVAPHPRVPRRIATTSAANSAPVDIPKLIITPGSVHHNSLPSFLEYAKRTNLSPQRTYYVGTHYEYTTALALMRLGFSLLRVGRKQDAGIDLIGHWVLAPLREPLPVIIQCKARKISITPSHVRELEGSFQGIPPDWRKKQVLGLLVTTKKATKGVLEALGQSRWPMGFVLVSRDGTVQQFVWNRAASEQGLEGVGVTVRYTPRALVEGAKEGKAEEGKASKKGTKKQLAKSENSGTRKDIQMTWMGSPIFPDRDNLDQETVKLMRVIEPDADVCATTDKYKDVKTKPAVGVKSGRPKGSTTTRTPPSVTEVPRKRGRPKGSKTLRSAKAPSPRGGQIPKAPRTPSTKVETRGRPKGSKNKPKPAVDAG